MVRRTITDHEIGLIRAMHSRGMANKDIQFFFNRPDRSVNSGRISDIGSGRYGPEVPAATEAEVSAFVESHVPQTSIGAISVPSVPQTETKSDNPIDPARIAAMFSRDIHDIWRLTAGETDEHECKSNFGLRHRSDWIRAIAALANNRGGYIFFGVLDKDSDGEGAANDSYKVAGLPNDAFQKADPSQISTLVKDALDPTPRIRIGVSEIGGLPIGIIHVEQHPGRPVIVRATDSGGLREGDIFFRYPGRSDRIKYSDLRAILDERDAIARRDIMPLVAKLIEIGPKQAFIADLKNGMLEGSDRQIVIDSALVDQISFIREGEFSEITGAPALRLVGDVTMLDGKSIGEKIVRLNVTPDAVLRNFLKEEPIAQPLQYIIFHAHSPRVWLPIWYYVRNSGKSAEDIAAILENEDANYRTSRDCAIDRLLGRASAFKSTPGKPTHLLAEFAAGRIEMPGGGKEDSAFALAVQGLPDGHGYLQELRAILATTFERSHGEGQQLANRRSAIFRAACRLDELLYGPKLVGGPFP